MHTNVKCLLALLMLYTRKPYHLVYFLFYAGPNHASPDSLHGNLSGRPFCLSHVTNPTELNTGDHILFQTPHCTRPCRPSYQSALVENSEKDIFQIISYSRGGIYQDDTNFSSFGKVFRVEYTRCCRYSGRRAVIRARVRIDLGEDHYHALFNNSHFFVSWAKTGNEHSLASIIDGLAFNEGNLLY